MTKIQPFSYHTHTIFSDGDNTVSEMLQQAVQLGWEEIGISDHMVIHPRWKESYSWKTLSEKYRSIYYDDFDAFYEYAARNIEHIRTVAYSFPLKVRVGFEVDYFPLPEWQDNFVKLRDKLDADYLITGNHFLLNEQGDDLTNSRDFEKHYPDVEMQRKVISRHFDTLIEAIKSGFFDFAAHIDYMRKVDICGFDGFKTERRRVIKALAESGMAYELSTKGFRKSGDFYPVRWMLEELKEYNVPVVISDDAHRISELGCEFERAEETLAGLDYTNRWRLPD